MCGNGISDAAVSFVMTARFSRNHWKYRRHQKAYAGILMDAAHLSQTLYLVSGEPAWGRSSRSPSTPATSNMSPARRISEGVIAMVGCGPRAPGESPLSSGLAARPTNRAWPPERSLRLESCARTPPGSPCAYGASGGCRSARPSAPRRTTPARAIGERVTMEQQEISRCANATALSGQSSASAPGHRQR